MGRGIAREMGLDGQCEIALWNVELLGTLFGRAAALDASEADIIIIALRGGAGLSLDLKIWLRRWLAETRDIPVALIAVFEDQDGPAARETRAFIERAAVSAEKDCFSQPIAASARNARPRETLWVL